MIYTYCTALRQPFVPFVIILCKPLPMPYAVESLLGVFWHEAGDRAHFKMLGNAGLSKIALPQVAAAARVKTSGMRDDTSSECDTFSLTNWNVFFSSFGLILKRLEI